MSPSVSTVVTLSAPADGSTPGLVRIQLLDANGSPVQGKSVAVSVISSTAVVSDSPAVTDAQGIATFNVTDTVAETLPVLAIDTTDTITLSSQPTITFVPPPAAAGNILAAPPTVANDGSSAATIVVTLQNAEGQPAEGKTIELSDGASDAQIIPTGATPGVTNSIGTATFTATDRNAQSVTFTAVDLTDGNLPVPDSATVNFTGDPSSACATGNPTAENGANVSVVANGFPTGPQGLNSCAGTFGIAFDGDGNLYVADQFQGSVYKFPPGGGVADPSTLIGSLLDTSGGNGLDDLTFGTDGELYGVLPDGTSGSPFCNDCGTVVQINSQTGTIVRTLTSTLNTPAWIATDPISGDLFVGNGGSGSLFSPDIWEIQNPASASPTVSVYATDTNGINQFVFVPNGTLYAVTHDDRLVSFGGTNTAQPATETTIANLPSAIASVALGPIGSNGAPSSVYVGGTNGDIYQVALPTETATQIETGAASLPIDMKAGPNGCLYAADGNNLITVSSTSGSCNVTPATGAPSISLSGPGVTNPPTGSPVTFTASLSNVASPAGTSVFFSVTGANPQVKLVDADVSGEATFTYTGVFQGQDTVSASFVSGSNEVVANQLRIVWAPGKDVTFTTLDPSSTAGQVNTTAVLSASLTDISQNPPTPINGEDVVIGVGATTCTALTGTNGTGSCSIVLPALPGIYPLTATFTDPPSYTSSSANASFLVSAVEAPVFTSPSASSFAAGESFTFYVTTTGTPTLAIILAMGSTLPYGVTLTDNGNGTATLVGTSSVAVGVYTFTMQASNSAGTTDQSFTLTVVTQSGGGGGGCLVPGPFFTSASTVHVIVGKRFTIDITTGGCPTPTVTKPQTLPKHIRFVPSGNGSAKLVGGVGVPAGNYSIILKSVNSHGTATQSFTLVASTG